MKPGDEFTCLELGPKRRLPLFFTRRHIRLVEKLEDGRWQAESVANGRRSKLKENTLNTHWAPVTHLPGIKPCPFCGAPATMEPWHGGGPDKVMIGCTDEGCFVSPSVTGEPASEAMRRWNNRIAGTKSAK